MKKTFLLFSFCAVACAANAQLTLTGTSYTQNFDQIGSGSGSVLPLPGWAAYSAATSSSVGTPDATVTLTFGPSTGFGRWNNASQTDTLTCASDIYGHGFKNCASNDAGAAVDTMTCAQQQAITNRAFGVRQVGSTTDAGFDPGVAFCLQLANTTGRTGFQLTFNLESLDVTCPRVTTWAVDYGIGATPTTFTTATATGTLTTGGNSFTNNSISVNFGTALDNKTTPVWIRIDALNTTTGSGNRTTSAIDDFHLTWTGTGPSGVSNVSAQPVLSLMVLGNATSDEINLEYSAEEPGNYNFSIYDLAGRVINTQSIDAQAGVQHISLNGLHLAPGMYIAKMHNANSSSTTRVVVQ